jgi:hypothetical protein
MHHTVSMVRRSVKRIELHRALWAIDNVVACAGGHEDRESWFDAVFYSVEHRLAFTLLNPEQLVEGVYLFTDVFTRLETHHDELTVLGRVQDYAERLVL